MLKHLKNKNQCDSCPYILGNPPSLEMEDETKLSFAKIPGYESIAAVKTDPRLCQGAIDEDHLCIGWLLNREGTEEFEEISNRYCLYGLRIHKEQIPSVQDLLDFSVGLAKFFE